MPNRIRALLVVLALAPLAGCLGSDSSEPDPGTGQGAGAKAYTPINRQGTLDVIRPTNPPTDASPVCLLLDAASHYGVLNLTAVITWEASSGGTETLRLELKTAGSGNDIGTEGPSPLALEAVPFNVTTGAKFGMLVSTVDQGPTDAVALAPQTVDFVAHFVAQRETDATDTDLGLWTSDC